MYWKRVQEARYAITIFDYLEPKALDYKMLIGAGCS
jgi:hypothetical protein